MRRYSSLSILGKTSYGWADNSREAELTLRNPTVVTMQPGRAREYGLPAKDP